VFGHRYFGARYFGPRYWGPAGVVPPPPGGVALGEVYFICNVGRMMNRG
jgi:hypothetical protein